MPPDHCFGYDHWLASNILEFTSHEYDTVMYDGEDNPLKLPGYRVDALTAAAIRYIDDQKNDPFFLSFIEPHHQNDVDDYPPPEGYRERFTGGWVPPALAALGWVWKALASLGVEEDTVLLHTSDHGYHFRTRRWKYGVDVPGADPYELENLVDRADLSVVREQLRVRLQGRMVDAGEDEPLIESHTGSK